MAAHPSSEPVTLIVLGAGGDLTERLMLPGLGELVMLEPDLDIRVVGAARSERDDWAEHVRGALHDADIDPTHPVVRRLVDRTRYQSTDATDAAALASLIGHDDTGRTIVYSALSPSTFSKPSRRCLCPTM